PLDNALPYLASQLGALLIPAVLPVCRLIRRRPPISTLFPYTTLFRSGLTGGVAHRSSQIEQAERAMDLGGQTRILDLRLIAEVQDRKSTRLNSSHGSISYAVFCLKKKKIDHTTPWWPIKTEGARDSFLDRGKRGIETTLSTEINNANI